MDMKALNIDATEGEPNPQMERILKNIIIHQPDDNWVLSPRYGRYYSIIAGQTVVHLKGNILKLQNGAIIDTINLEDTPIVSIEREDCFKKRLMEDCE